MVSGHGENYEEKGIKIKRTKSSVFLTSELALLIQIVLFPEFAIES